MGSSNWSVTEYTRVRNFQDIFKNFNQCTMESTSMSKCGYTSSTGGSSTMNLLRTPGRWYYHYLDEPLLWSSSRFTDPYWSRFHTEYERMMVQQDHIDEMFKKV